MMLYILRLGIRGGREGKGKGKREKGEKEQEGKGKGGEREILYHVEQHIKKGQKLDRLLLYQLT